MCAQTDQSFLRAPKLIEYPSQVESYQKESRKFTGIPSLAITPKGRYWAVWYTGNTASEDENNYVILATSQDQGETWKNVTNNLPKRWVTRVVAHPSLPGVAYVTLSGFRYGSASSHIYRTTDYGETWTGIDGDLPDIPVNDLVVDPNTQDLYIATDIGVYWSPNIGGHWEPLGSGMPTAIITDLDFDSSSQTLAAATYGRSAYYLKLDATTSRATKESGSRFQAY